MDPESNDENLGWKPIDFVGRAQRAALLSITPVLIREMQRDWGDKWLDRFNEIFGPKRFSGADSDKDEDKTFKEINGKLNWDFSELTRAIQLLLGKINYFSSGRFDGKMGQVKSLCYVVRQTRNTTAHASAALNYDDLQWARNQMDSLAGFAAILVGGEAAKQIRAIKKEMVAWAENRIEETAEQSGFNKAEVEQIKALLLELRTERQISPKTAVGEEPTSAPAPANAEQKTGGTSPGDAVEPTSEKPATLDANLKKKSIQRYRKNAIPAPGAGLALFPAVREPSDTDSELCYVNCSPLRMAYRSGPYMLQTGLDPKQADLCYAIVRNARQAERNLEHSVRMVHARFDPNEFEGPSFGLALAIADRSARYGYSSEHAGRHIIATGEILKGGQGEVGPIDGLDAKVRLLEREAQAGSLFIFPKANLPGLTDEAKELLNRAAERGTLTWRAISHVRELEDLFAVPADQPSMPEEAKPENGSSASLAAKGVEHTETEHGSADMVEVSPAMGKASRPSGRYRLLAGIAAGGIVLLGAVYGLSQLREELRGDPVAEQLDKERVEMMRRLAGEIPLAPEHAGNCTELLQALSPLSAAERQSLDLSFPAAATSSERCRSAFTDSDQRLAVLAKAAESAALTGASDAHRVFSARSALTAFDLSRAGEAEVSKLLTKTADAGTAIAESNARISKFAIAGQASMNSVSPSSDAELLASAGELTELDRRRLDAQQSAYLALSQDAKARLSASDLRLGIIASAHRQLLKENTAASRQSFQTAFQAITSYDRKRVEDPGEGSAAAALSDGQRLVSIGRITELEVAVAAYRAAPNETNRKAMVAAAKSLQGEDKALMTGDQQRLLDDVRDSELEVLSSSARLRALAQADQDLEQAKDVGSGIAIATEALIAAYKQLTEFDLSRLDDLQQLSAASAKGAEEDLAKSDLRIERVVRSAQVVLAAQAHASVELRAGLSAAFNDLSGLDRERMTPDQHALVNKACQANDRTAAGILQSDKNCILTIIEFGPPTLKPSYPAKQ